MLTFAFIVITPTVNWVSVFFFLCVSTEKKVLETLIVDILTRHTNEKCRHDYSNTIHVRCPSEAMSVSQHAPNQSST